MELILDANTLIYLVKANLHDDFFKLTKNNSLLIDTSVYEEVVERGLKHNYPDALIVQEFIEKRQIAIVPVDISNTLYKYRDPGETSCAILVSKQKEDRICISSDKRAITKFKTYDVPHSQLDIIYYHLLMQGRINQKTFFKILKKLENVHAINPERISYFHEIIHEEGNKYD